MPSVWNSKTGLADAFWGESWGFSYCKAPCFQLQPALTPLTCSKQRSSAGRKKKAVLLLCPVPNMSFIPLPFCFIWWFPGSEGEGKTCLIPRAAPELSVCSRGAGVSSLNSDREFSHTSNARNVRCPWGCGGLGKWRSHFGAVKKELPFFLCRAASGKAAKDAVTRPRVRASPRESLELRVCVRSFAARCGWAGWGSSPMPSQSLAGKQWELFVKVLARSSWSIFAGKYLFFPMFWLQQCLCFSHPLFVTAGSLSSVVPSPETCKDLEGVLSPRFLADFTPIKPVNAWNHPAGGLLLT